MKLALSLGVLSSVLCLSFAAQAQEAFTAEKLTASVGLNYGLYTGDEIGDINPYGLGFHARAGYTLPMNLYLGGMFEYYLGGSEDIGGLGELSMNISQLMAEVGYDIALGDTAVIRPVLGLGMSFVSGESCIDDVTVPGFGTIEGECADNSESELAVAPGAVALLDFGSVFGTGSLRYNHIFVEDGSAAGLLLGVGVGMKF